MSQALTGEEAGALARLCLSVCPCDHSEPELVSVYGLAFKANGAPRRRLLGFVFDTLRIRPSFTAEIALMG